MLKMRPSRKQLPHEIPDWVDPDRAAYFITICCDVRGTNQLTKDGVADSLLDTIRHRHEKREWYVQLALRMPDHVHFITLFPETEKRTQTVVSKWKEWTAKRFGIKWQRDFFEHRLRANESFEEKADYIRANPVRAGLVKNA